MDNRRQLGGYTLINKTLLERFSDKYTIHENGCWMWHAATNGRGYGQIHMQGRPYRAHRLSWELANNAEVPDGLLVLHRCNTTLCVNPDHLYAGTPLQNAQDRVRAESLAGVRNGSTTLTREEVREMIRLSKQGRATTQLALEFGTSYSNAWAVVTGRSRRVDTHDLLNIHPILDIAA